RLLDHAGRALRVGHRGVVGDRLTALGGDLRHDGVGRRAVHAHIVHHHLRPAPRQGEGVTAAQTTTGTGDDRDSAVKVNSRQESSPYLCFDLESWSRPGAVRRHRGYRIASGSQVASSGNALMIRMATHSASQNGTRPRNTVPSGMLVRRATRKLISPTGGVSRPVSSIMMVSTPNQTPL